MGLSVIIQSLTNSFPLFCACRLIQGLTCASFTPAIFSMMADIFPKNWRQRANSVYYCGMYIGGGISSLFILTMMRFGWRISMGQMGAGVIILGLLCLFGLQEPKRSKKMSKKDKNQKISFT